MDELLITLDTEPVFVIELDGNQGITDPPDLYQLAVQNGYLGSRENWLLHQFSPTEIDPSLPDFVAHWLTAG